MANSLSKQLNLLLIDDDAFILDLLVRMLKKLGYKNITTALNGKAALAALVTADPSIDLIISDLNMPEMDGVEFIRHIKTAKFAGGIIFLSGEDKRILNISMHHALAQGLNVLGGIRKPVNSLLLSSLLTKYIPKAEVRPQLKSDSSISERELLTGIRSPYSDQLLLLYQPKVHIASREIAGVEAFAHWKHPERGVLSSEAFIPVAEATGLAKELAYKICKKAILQTSNWLSDGIRLNTSFNVPISIITNKEFSQYLIDTADKLEVPLSQFVVGLAEKEVTRNIDECMEYLVNLRLKRCGIAMIDCGFERSSMAQLGTMPFTEIKVSDDILRRAENNHSTRAFLEAIVMLANQLNIDTVAMGVKTRNQWNLAESIGMDFMQGNYIARPMEGYRVSEFLTSWNNKSREADNEEVNF